GHEQIKDQIRRDVQAEVEVTADQKQTQPVVEQVTSDLKNRAVQDVAGAESELDRAKRAARFSQIVDYIFYLIYGIIGLVIVLELLGARESSGFKQFMDTISAPVLAPFRGLMRDPAVGSSQLMLSYIIGLGVWILIHVAINGALRLFVHKKTAV
ncbi:MAG TPA: hypothetical protein VI958_07830, partial [Acidobacteriota bacterium]